MITKRRVRLAAKVVSAGLCAALLAACSPAGSGRAAEAAAVTAPPRYTIEQAISDRAQLNTIAFDALGFLSGSLGSDSFFPPGKVADFWGFQYLRDNDPTEMGHNTDFLTKAALNTYTTLNAGQRAKLKALATSQVDSINEYGYKRFVLMDAFRRQLSGDVPTGSAGLSEDAVKAYSAQLYQLDGRISYERAQVMGEIISSLSADQKATLDALATQGMAAWPNVPEPEDMRTLTGDEKVAVMTYSGDLFSWYAGNVEADVYFCPERQGTYFGSFYLKDAKAVGNPGYSIPTTITGDMGETFLNSLTDAQRTQITSLVDAQRSDLTGIVTARRDVATQLRRFMAGESAEPSAVAGLMGDYGAHDGALVYRYAMAFSAVGKTLTAEQRAQIAEFRRQLVGDLEPEGAFLYSRAIPMPEIPNTDFLFSRPATTAPLPRTGHLLGAPGVPSFVPAGRALMVSGFLKPRHPAGATSVRIEGYRSENGVWVRRGTWVAKNSDYSTYTKYTASISTALSGRWRFRAVHVHTGFQPAYSPWTYAVVR